MSVFIDSVASLSDDASSFINKVSFVIFLYYRNPVHIVIKVAHHRMRVEIVELDIERGMQLSIFINVRFTKHFFAVQVVDYVSFTVC